jgi:hypothetical protein
MTMCCTSFINGNVRIALDKKHVDSVYSLQWDCSGNLNNLHETSRQCEVA